MSKEIKIPDIGGAEGVDVIEVMISQGDTISVDDSLITLESDKASMEIPSPVDGMVKEVRLSVGDKVSEGDVIFILDQASLEPDEPVVKNEVLVPKDEKQASKVETVIEDMSRKPSTSPENVVIPDIGDASDVDVIDVMVKVGDDVKKEDALITLEGDKATMDIPSPFSGKVESLAIKVGDKVSQGSLILTISSEDGQENQLKTSRIVDEQSTKQPPKEPTIVSKTSQQKTQTSVEFDDKTVYAGPAVRRFARELGVNLTKVVGSGRKGRITKEDVQAFVKDAMKQAPSSTGVAIPQGPKIDFAKFGEIERVSLNKIKRITAVNMHRSWLSVPHVTQFDDADVTELDAFRKAKKQEAEKQGYKLTVLAFVTKACANALEKFGQFNASLDETGEQLILKKYINIGIAVDTPNGLVVPVIKACDKKSVSQIARDMGELSLKAREKRLLLADMSGGCFTISSLGGIGGTAFTPIVNHPEVAILGLSRNVIKPVFDGKEFIPRLMLPLSLSYDHRVIDGAEAARFTTYLSQLLSDIRTLLL
jgi:pyruvate dehydrogenase E2 component (dihydrolipoyllysine-residue acetyltransferase)